MIRYLATLAIIFTMVPSLFAQTLTSALFSPLLGIEKPIPYREIDFLSVRMQGLGYQLYNVVGDTVTDLFRNPATLYNINQNLFLFNYERPTYAEDIYHYSTKYYYYLPYNPRRFPPTGNSPSPYFSAGYWSSHFLKWNFPVGIFIRAASSGEKEENSSGYPPAYSTNADDSYEFNQQVRLDDFKGQLWIGLLKKQKFHLGLFYNFKYLNLSSRVDITNQSMHNHSSTEIHLSEQFTGNDETTQWRRHRLSLGASVSSGTWRIEPEISAFYFSMDEINSSAES
ncbi:MAG: hypothetical protein ACE5GL_07985, partial [Calditrichia bacterium]